MEVPTGAERVAQKAAILVEHPLFEIAGTSITLSTLVSIGVVLLATLFGARTLSALFGRLLRRRGKTGEGETVSYTHLTLPTNREV